MRIYPTWGRPFKSSLFSYYYLCYFEIKGFRRYFRCCSFSTCTLNLSFLKQVGWLELLQPSWTKRYLENTKLSMAEQKDARQSG